MSDRPTCGTCPHNVRGACYLNPADGYEGARVAEHRPGCQHHPHMVGWLASIDGAESSGADQLAELEQWRKALVWRKYPFVQYMWRLGIYESDAVVVLNSDGNWRVKRVDGEFSSRDEAMRAAEAALGLPKCRVEGEP